ncbi:hypothetical protein HOL34_04020 [bacterium]|nr:hypothetical protein [bacterium]
MLKNSDGVVEAVKLPVVNKAFSRVSIDAGHVDTLTSLGVNRFKMPNSGSRLNKEALKNLATRFNCDRLKGYIPSLIYASGDKTQQVKFSELFDVSSSELKLLKLSHRKRIDRLVGRVDQ